MSAETAKPSDITQAVVASLKHCADPRLQQVLGAVIRHLHAAVQEVGLTQAEWEAAVAFLTATGQTCTDVRQEFILLSDVLGISMLVDDINHAGGGVVTDSTVFGPFYTGRQPTLPMGSSILKQAENGDPLTMTGTIRDAGGQPISGAMIEVWQTAPNGLYDVQDSDQAEGNLRATFVTGPDGTYRFQTIMPVSYPIPDDGPVGVLLKAVGRHPFRPAHVHFMICAAGHKRLVTHLFIAGDPYLDSDAVFGVKPSLVVAPEEDGAARLVRYDFVLGTELPL